MAKGSPSCTCDEHLQIKKENPPREKRAGDRQRHFKENQKWAIHAQESQPLGSQSGESKQKRLSRPGRRARAGGARARGSTKARGAGGDPQRGRWGGDSKPRRIGALGGEIGWAGSLLSQSCFLSLMTARTCWGSAQPFQPPIPHGAEPCGAKAGLGEALRAGGTVSRAPRSPRWGHLGDGDPSGKPRWTAGTTTGLSWAPAHPPCPSRWPRFPQTHVRPRH